MKIKQIWSTKVHKRDEIRIEVLTEKGNEQFDLDIKEAELFSVDLEIMLKRLRRDRYKKTSKGVRE